MNFYQQLFMYMGCAARELPGCHEPTEPEVLTAAQKTIRVVGATLGRLGKETGWLSGLRVALNNLNGTPLTVSARVAGLLCQIAEKICVNGRGTIPALALFIDLLQRRRELEAADDFRARLLRAWKEEADAEKIPEDITALLYYEEIEAEELRLIREVKNGRCN